LLGVTQLVRLAPRVRVNVYLTAGALTLIGVFAMRWIVVIGGQLFSAVWEERDLASDLVHALARGARLRSVVREANRVGDGMPDVDVDRHFRRRQGQRQRRAR
jgi:hypothetical protein